MKKLLLLINVMSFLLPVRSQTWNLGGNSATNPATDFLGTSDNEPLIFRINSQFSGKIDSVSGLTFFGYGAGLNSTTGIQNTAIGFKSLLMNSTGKWNTANGFQALNSNTTGIGNSAFGAFSLASNKIGMSNTAIGLYSLYLNTTGEYNTADGANALYQNTTGKTNTAVGMNALSANISGNQNTAVGYAAMGDNTTGTNNTVMGYAVLGFGSGSLSSYNTAIGTGALYNTTNSAYNTAIGYNAGGKYNLGWNNTILGANCNGSAADQYNIIAIGQGVTCPDNSTARIGNSATWSIGGFANWTNISDSRFKKDIHENVKGLDFIMKLRPVTYHLDVTGSSKQVKENGGEEWNEIMKTAISEKEKIAYSGFMAQEVEQAAKEVGYDFSGVDKPRTKDALYGLRYAEFVVPLVKAVQELSAQNIELKKQLEDLQKRIKKLESPISKK